MKIKEKWVAWEELLSGFTPAFSINFSQVGGMTAGSIPFADAAGFLDEDNANLFWDATNFRLGIGTATPDVTLDIEFDAVVTVVSRVSAKTRPWRHWECVDGNWGLAVGINADDGIIHFHYDTPIGTVDTCMMVFDGPNGRVGILDDTPAYPFDVGGNTRIQGTFRATGAVTFLSTLQVDSHITTNGNITSSGLANLYIQIDSNSSARFIADASDADAYVDFQEDNATKWTVGFDFTDSLKFQISEGVPGTNVRFEIEPGGPANFYVNVVLTNGISLNLEEDITFTGATGVNLIKFPDALANALSFMEGANPYVTFITTNGSEAIQFHEDVLLRGSTEYAATNKTTGAWVKSIGGGGDYADWATMIAAMPNMIAHAVTVTIEAGTTLTEICELKNKHGITSAAVITIQAERYYPMLTGSIPTADSATATTLRDAALAAEAFGNDYFNGCWVFVVHGTGTDNGFVVITDYVDATGDVVVAAWPGTQPDNTSRYIIVGAMIDCAGTRNYAMDISSNTLQIYLFGIGMDDANLHNLYIHDNLFCWGESCGIHGADGDGIRIWASQFSAFYRSGIVGNNTDNATAFAGINSIRNSPYSRIDFCGISDNNQRGILIHYGSFALVANNFGDSNGNWGTYAQFSGSVRISGSECSGAAGNHSDPGTAGAAASDQAAVY